MDQPRDAEVVLPASWRTIRSLSIDALLRMLDEQRAQLERSDCKESSLRFRGSLRREAKGAAPIERRRYAAALHWLAQQSTSVSKTLDIEFVRELHDRAVGGRTFRASPLRVGFHH